LTVEPRAVDPHCFDADADPDPAQNLDADPDPDPGGGISANNVHPPWQNPRYAPGRYRRIFCLTTVPVYRYRYRIQQQCWYRTYFSKNLSTYGTYCTVEDLSSYS
jgi:hypothetical protein